mgnify:CR=1 FL=1
MHWTKLADQCAHPVLLGAGFFVQQFQVFNGTHSQFHTQNTPSPQAHTVVADPAAAAAAAVTHAAGWCPHEAGVQPSQADLPQQRPRLLLLQVQHGGLLHNRRNQGLSLQGAVPSQPRHRTGRIISMSRALTCIHPLVPGQEETGVVLVVVSAHMGCCEGRSASLRTGAMMGRALRLRGFGVSLTFCHVNCVCAPAQLHRLL